MFRYSYIVIPPLESLGFERRVRETLALLKECGYSGVEVNLTDSPALDLDRLEQWLDELDLVIPSFHMNVEERSLVEPILECGSSLRHVHLCESNGSLLGSGHLDFAAVLGALDRIGYEGFASVKVYRGAGLEDAAPHSLRYLGRLHAGTPPPGRG